MPASFCNRCRVRILGGAVLCPRCSQPLEERKGPLPKIVRHPGKAAVETYALFGDHRKRKTPVDQDPAD